MAQDKRNTVKGARSAGREARLAEALRENLRRRKRQARARKGKQETGEAKPGGKS